MSVNSVSPTRRAQVFIQNNQPDTTQERTTALGLETPQRKPVLLAQGGTKSNDGQIPLQESTAKASILQKINGEQKKIIQEEAKKAAAVIKGDMKEREKPSLSLPKIDTEEITGLIRFLGKKNEDISGAMNKLIKIGAPAVPFLVKALTRWSENEEDKFIVDNSARILGEIGLPAVPELKKALKTHQGVAKTYTIIALGLMAPKVEEAVPPLIQILEKDPDENQRSNAAFVLGKAGIVALPAKPVLQKAANEDNSPKVKKKAQGALVEITKDEMRLNELVTNLQNKDPKVRHLTLFKIQMVLDADSRASFKYIIPELIKLLADRNEDYGNIPLVAANDLAAFGPMAKRALPAIIKASGISWLGQTTVHKNFPTILEKIGPPAKEDVPEIIELLKSENWLICLNAIRTLSLAGADAKEALPLLENLKGQEND